MNEGQRLHYAQMSEYQLQNDKSPEASEEIRRRNNLNSVPSGLLGIANVVAGRYFG